MTTLKDIFGQESAIETLTRAYESDRLPHGLIFAGPVGVGKATAAGALATLFLCENPKNNQPCGKCPSCTLMDGGEHPDFRIIYRELIRSHDKTGKTKGTTLSIQVIRPELLERAARTAVRGRGKVFVIEQADYMEHPAQNALLKTLEEPIGRTLIILLTDRLHELLPTVRSRCQIIRFAPLDAKVVQRELEKRKIDHATATEASRLANGSLGGALQWIEDGVVVAARDLVKQLDGLLSGKGAADLAEWLKKAAEDHAARQLKKDELASKDHLTREALTLYLKIAADHFRAKLGETGDAEEQERVCDAIESVVRAESYLDSNVNVALSLQQFSSSLERRFALT